MKLKGSFEQLIAMVKNHRFLEIKELMQGRPATDDLFDKFSDYHGIAIPQDIKNAYSEMNGFTLVYGLKDESDEAVAQFNKISNDYMVEKGPPYIVGSIKFLDFQQAFLDHTWAGILYDRGAMSDE